MKSNENKIESILAPLLLLPNFRGRVMSSVMETVDKLKSLVGPNADVAVAIMDAENKHLEDPNYRDQMDAEQLETIRFCTELVIPRLVAFCTPFDKAVLEQYPLTQELVLAHEKLVVQEDSPNGPVIDPNQVVNPPTSRPNNPSDN